MEEIIIKIIWAALILLFIYIMINSILSYAEGKKEHKKFIENMNKFDNKNK